MHLRLHILNTLATPKIGFFQGIFIDIKFIVTFNLNSIEYPNHDSYHLIHGPITINIAISNELYKIESHHFD